jgi:hypothetical protein
MTQQHLKRSSIKQLPTRGLGELGPLLTCAILLTVASLARGQEAQLPTVIVRGFLVSVDCRLELTALHRAVTQLEQSSLTARQVGADLCLVTC